MHELTEKITDRYSFGSGNVEINKIITDWLEEKTDLYYKTAATALTILDLKNHFGLSNPCHPPLHPMSNVYGLKRCEKCGNHITNRSCKCGACKHEMDRTWSCRFNSCSMLMDNGNFCPSCGEKLEALNG